MRILTPLYVAAAVSLAVASSAYGQGTTFAKRFPAEATGAVQITNVAGTITVKTWDRPEIDIKARLHGNIDKVEVTQQSGRSVIEVIYPSLSTDRRSADLELSIPAGSQLEVSAVSASIDVSGIRGATRLKAVSGSIRSDVPGAEFEAKSVSGNITLQGSSKPADMRISTVSGSASLQRGAGSVDARTTSGNLELDLAAARTVRARSTSGSLELTGRLADDARVEAETVSGEVSLHAQAENGFRYDVSSLSGRIRNCFGTDAARASSHGPGQVLNGTRGAGQASLRLKSLSGSIDLCDR